MMGDRARRASVSNFRFWLLALTGVVAGTSSGRAQTINIYDANGFEPSSFSPGALGTHGLGGPAGQQSWNTTDFNQVLGLPAGSIQTGTVQGGSQAFQITGNRLLDDPTFAGQTFWYRNFPSAATAFNPASSGTPVVRVNYNQQVTGSGIITTSDIPVVGIYMEGYSQSTGQQQQIGSILLNLNNGVTAFTVGGTAITSANNLYTRNVWHDLEVEFNFSSQTYRAFLDGSLLTFGAGGLSDVPFRNSNGPTDRLAEYGFQASFNEFSGTTTNNAFFDNFRLVGVAAVPEPSSLLLIVGAAAGFRILRRSRRQG